MKFNSFFAPIAAAFRAAALRLSMVDGKPGLSVDDFSKVIDWTINLRSGKDTNATKATIIADAIVVTFGHKLPVWPWIPYAIGWAAHYVAKRLFPTP